MSKHKTRNEWIKLFKKYESDDWEWNIFYASINRYKTISTAKKKEYRNIRRWKYTAKQRFKNKYKQWKMLDNMFMIKTRETRGTTRKKPKRDDSDIPSIIDKLNEEQKREILERWIKDQRDKKDKKDINSYKTLGNSLKAKIVAMHRTTFYKKPKKRKYKFDHLKDKITELHYENKMIYGSKRLSVLLAKDGINIGDRTLRNYMNRWNLKCKTRQKRKQSESKNVNVKFNDLVRRNYNPEQDNIIATDVSYIPAKVLANNIYLSVAISHKTKLIESWKLSLNNDTDLVLKTLKDLKRTNFILHSDHGSQYSSLDVQNWNKKHSIQTSMSRVGNSLDNREIEYFFGCLKSEHLNHLPTYTMTFDEIKKEIKWYIEWYNTKRIQKRLQWKTPTEVSAYAI